MPPSASASRAPCAASKRGNTGCSQRAPPPPSRHPPWPDLGGRRFAATRPWYQLGVIALRNRRPARAAARAQVHLVRAEEAERVAETGAVGSIQEAEVTMPQELVAEIWKPEYLERLARSYWAWLSRATLGLVRVVYAAGLPLGRAAQPPAAAADLPRPRVRAPSRAAGAVTWRIARGLLVAREGRDRNGFLRIRVCRAGTATSDGGDETLAGGARGPQLLPLAARLAGASRASAPGSTARPSCASTCSSATGSCARSRASTCRRRGSGARRRDRRRRLEGASLSAADGGKTGAMRRKPILVTGATGFIGRRLAARLLERRLPGPLPGSRSALGRGRELEPARLRARGCRPDPPGRARGCARRRRGRLLPRPHDRRRRRLPGDRARRRRPLRPRGARGRRRADHLPRRARRRRRPPSTSSARHQVGEALRRRGPAADLLPRRDGDRPRQRVLRAAARDRRAASRPARARLAALPRPSRSALGDVVDYLREALDVPESAGPRDPDRRPGGAHPPRARQRDGARARAADRRGSSRSPAGSPAPRRSPRAPPR